MFIIILFLLSLLLLLSLLFSRKFSKYCYSQCLLALLYHFFKTLLLIHCFIFYFCPVYALCYAFVHLMESMPSVACKVALHFDFFCTLYNVHDWRVFSSSLDCTMVVMWYDRKYYLIVILLRKEGEYKEKISYSIEYASASIIHNVIMMGQRER